MMNKIRKIGMEILGAYVRNNYVQYVGPKFLGHYGNLYENYKEIKYTAGVAKEILDIAGGIIILDKNKGAKRIMENLYFNGRGNYIFIDEETGYSYYFNLKDSSIIRKYLCTRGRKYFSCKEDIFEVLGNYKSLKTFNKHLRDKDITINGTKYKFHSYNEFYKTMDKEVWTGYDKKFKIKVNEKTLEWIFWSCYGWNFIEVR